MTIVSIEEGRKEIADIDARIAELISERIATAKEIGRIKREFGLPIRDHDAETKVLQRYERFAAEYDLPENNMESIARNLMDMAIEKEEES